MLVYGDQRDVADPREWLARVAERLGQAAALGPEPERHAALVAALVETGRLLQGLADAEFDRAGVDRSTPATTALSSFAMELARAVVRSWDSWFMDPLEVPRLPQLGELQRRVELRVPEGYAFYALYPEAYLEAARRLELGAPPRVIGIRSIGTSLAPVVACALGAPAPVTVRPFGDPFAREIALAIELERELLDGEFHYVVVDEGPGQSGSSFGAVADWLQQRGVPLDRIGFLPSHSGPLGLQASDAHRRRWASSQNVAGDFGADLRPLLEQWLVPVLGPMEEPLEELSGGAWRPHVFPEEQDWPAAYAMWERRKFLATAGGERFLVKFAGLGEIGERKLAMARALHAVGMAAEPVALVHGFMIERWCDGARPLGAGERPVSEIARYVGARARLFPAPDESGATLGELLQMTHRNVTLALGEHAATALDRWSARLDPLSRRVVRVRTDNRLDRHEWLRTAEGRLLKTDALDHHCAHDLVGCQDLAWDVAGAIIEFGLGAEEAGALTVAAEAAGGRAVDRELLDLYCVAYCAFRLGQASMAGEGAAHDTVEAARLQARASDYSAHLEHLLDLSSTATRRESLVSSGTERTGSGTNFLKERLMKKMQRCRR